MTLFIVKRLEENGIYVEPEFFGFTPAHCFKGGKPKLPRLLHLFWL